MILLFPVVSYNIPIGVYNISAVAACLMLFDCCSQIFVLWLCSKMAQGVPKGEGDGITEK